MEETEIYGELPKITQVESEEFNIETYRFEEWILVNIRFKKMLEVNESKELLELISAYIRTNCAKYGYLILSGRMPLWFAMALHHSILHSFKTIAIFDPKQRGAVIVSSHTRKYRTFDIVELPEDIITQIIQ